MRKMGTSIMVQLFDLTYSSKFLGTHNQELNWYIRLTKHFAIKVSLGRRKQIPVSVRLVANPYCDLIVNRLMAVSTALSRFTRVVLVILVYGPENLQKTISLCSCRLKHTYYVYQSICLSICRSICIYDNIYLYIYLYIYLLN